ncbi:MAG: hypothetical protein ACI4U0_05690 [Candidatus Aphodocola sp.]
MFDVGKMYCKYVINTIYKSIKKLKYNTDLYKQLDDKLYESYLKLEKLINSDSFKS